MEEITELSTLIEIRDMCADIRVLLCFVCAYCIFQAFDYAFRCKNFM